MKIGYHDHNQPSALTPAIVYGREEGRIDFVEYDVLPQGRLGERLDAFIINPVEEDDPEYWDGIRKFITANGKLTILVLSPDKDPRAERVVAGTRAELLTMRNGGTDKLLKIMGGKI